MTLTGFVLVGIGCCTAAFIAWAVLLWRSDQNEKTTQPQSLAKTFHEIDARRNLQQPHRSPAAYSEPRPNYGSDAAGYVATSSWSDGGGHCDAGGSGDCGGGGD